MVKRITILILCFCLLSVPVRAAETEKLVALTFDDGPSGKYTRKLLEGLEERDAKVTFLLCGYRIEQYPELIERICLEGHEIGLHGYSHKPMKDMCQRDTAQEIRKTIDLLPEGCDFASWVAQSLGSSDQCRMDKPNSSATISVQVLHNPPGGRRKATSQPSGNRSIVFLISWAVSLWHISFIGL